MALPLRTKDKHWLFELNPTFKRTYALLWALFMYTLFGSFLCDYLVICTGELSIVIYLRLLIKPPLNGYILFRQLLLAHINWPNSFYDYLGICTYELLMMINFLPAFGNPIWVVDKTNPDMRRWKGWSILIVRSHDLGILYMDMSSINIAVIFWGLWFIQCYTDARRWITCVVMLLLIRWPQTIKSILQRLHFAGAKSLRSSSYTEWASKWLGVLKWIKFQMVECCMVNQ